MRLLREVLGDDAEARRLETDAAALKERFDGDFWSRSRRHYARALDGDKQQVDSLTSDLGQLLWSGIVAERRARATVRVLMSRDLHTGWGIRSMSAGEAGYNPLGYHVGTVWPHDTAFAAAGMRRYGFDDETATVCKELLDAAEAFSNQLPEVFAGFARDETGIHVEYADALKPQSWAAGAPLLAIRTLLGLEPAGRRLRSKRITADSLAELRLRGIRFRGTRVDAG